MASPLEKSQFPVCSVEYAQAHGYDVSKVPTCHPEKTNGIRGCSQWKSCRFDRTQYGGFKGTRPHMIGYFLRPLDGPPKVDQCACYNFVMALQPLMDEGLALRMKGQQGQVVRIVAQEGQPIKLKRYPQAVDKAGNRTTRMEVKEIPLPRFPEPHELDESLEYERGLEEQYDAEVARMTAMPEAEA